MNFVIVDKFEICRSGFKNLLIENFNGCAVFEASDLSKGIKLAENKKIDLFLIDIDNLDDNNPEEFDRLKKLSKDVPTVAITVQKGMWLKRAFELNFSGYIEKQNTFEIVVSALKLILAGGKFFPPDLFAEYSLNANYGEEAGPLQNGIGWVRPLTQRQQQVLKCLAEGKSNKVIARELDISAGTVKTHISGILKDLKATNRTQAVNIANHLNIL